MSGPRSVRGGQPRPGRSTTARIGVYGGTFNPIHLAHLILAEEIRERFSLGTVLFVPSGRPPHKSHRMPSGRQRLEMVRLAIAGNPAFAALDLEVRKEGLSYTVETLRELHRRHGPAARFLFLIGMDAFTEIRTWHEADRLLDLADFAVFPRVGHRLEDPRPYLPPAWRAGPPGRTRAGVSVLRAAGGGRIHLVDTETFSLAASTVRRRAARGRSIRYLVPDPVARYIRRRGLYAGRG